MIFIYNALFILFIGFIMKRKIDTKRGKIFFLIITFSQMALIQGLRDISVGTDTALYVNTYNNYLNSEVYSFQFTHYEPLFRIMCNFFHKMNFDSTIFLLIISCITMYGFAYFIYKNSSNVILGTFIFACMLYPNSFNIMRQYLALSISVNAYKFFLEKKDIKGILLIALASQIHSTSLVLLVLIPLRYIKKKETKFIIITFLIPIIFLFGDYFVIKILTIMGKSFYISKYLANRLFRTTTFINIITYFLLEFFVKNCTNDTKKNEISYLANIGFVNMFFGIFYLKYEYFSRLIELLNSYLVISLPLGLSNKFYLRPVIRIAVYSIPFILMLNAVYNSGSGIEEFKFFFSK